MLLLYPKSRMVEAWPSNIYIPLCFYFIRYHQCDDIVHQHKFTFHYASTLSTYVDKIPASVKTNLHSTMLLLYQFLHEFFCISCNNLHSTMLLLYLDPFFCQQPWHVHLHSTMLLLYPESGADTADSYSAFTFHYASTLSPIGKDGITIEWLFTFHYASTLSPSPFSPSTFFNTVILFVYPLSA